MGHYGFDDIGDGQDPGFERDILPGQALGVAGPVQSLMVLAQDGTYGPGPASAPGWTSPPRLTDGPAR